MAIRISRRAKYVIVLAVITVLLYGSFGTNHIDALNSKAASSFQDVKETYAETSAFTDKPLTESVEDLKEDTVAALPSLPDSTNKVPPVDASLPLQDATREPSRIPANSPIFEPIQEPADLQHADHQLQSKPDITLVEEIEPIQTFGTPKIGTTTSPLPTIAFDNIKFQLGRKENFPIAKDKLLRLPTGVSSKIPKIQTKDPSLTESSAEKQLRLQRQAEVRDVFKRDWAAYKKYAWMHDELRPVTNGTNDPFGGWGATLVDSLDTMLIMDLDEEYAAASEAVAKIDFTYTSSRAIPLFETTIRYLGGLLAAYDMGIAKGRKDSVLLSQAITLGHVLYGAFDTHNRMPLLKYDYRKQAEATTPERAPRAGCMAEVGSLSVEFTRLAQLADGDDKDRFFDAVQRITDALESSLPDMSSPGLWPLMLDISGCEPTLARFPSAAKATSLAETLINTSTPAESIEKVQKATDELLGLIQDHQDVTNRVSSNVKRQFPVAPSSSLVATPRGGATTTSQESVCKPQGIKPYGSQHSYSQGGQADSTYEYFTKEYLLLGGGTQAEQYKRLYETTMEATKKFLLFKPLVPGDLGAHELLMSGDLLVKRNKEPQFVPKMQHLTCFIGGMFAMGSKVFSRPDDLELAKKLTDGCVWAYDYVPTGVAPEVFHVHECKDETCSWKDHLASSARTKDAFPALSEHEAPAWAAQDALTREADSRVANVKRAELDFEEEGGANFAASLAAANHKSSELDKAHVPKPDQENLNEKALFWIDERYILRPEAIESVWYMYRITGDKSWQEKGWKMWQATEKLTRTAIAHTAVTGVMDATSVKKSDSLESFWFAETLKYYYLLFSDFETVSLDDYVLNTEAHPFARPRA